MLVGDPSIHVQDILENMSDRVSNNQDIIEGIAEEVQHTEVIVGDVCNDILNQCGSIDRKKPFKKHLNFWQGHVQYVLIIQHVFMLSVIIS